MDKHPNFFREGAKKNCGIYRRGARAPKRTLAMVKTLKRELATMLEGVGLLFFTSEISKLLKCKI